MATNHFKKYVLFKAVFSHIQFGASAKTWLKVEIAKFKINSENIFYTSLQEDVMLRSMIFLHNRKKVCSWFSTFFRPHIFSHNFRWRLCMSLAGIAAILERGKKLEWYKVELNCSSFYHLNSFGSLNSFWRFLEWGPGPPLQLQGWGISGFYRCPSR